MVKTIHAPNMKTIFIICVLLASILFSPSSILARELADRDQSGSGQTRNPNKPALKCDPKSSTYSSCMGQTKPKPKCTPKSIYTHCKGTDPSGNPNNLVVKSGTDPSGNLNNLVVKPDTGKTENSKNPAAVNPGTGTGGANDPKGVCHPNSPTYKSCVAKQNPKGKSKCVPGAGGAYTRCPPHDP